MKANKNLPRLARRYAATLRKYLANEQEAVLEQAYELGRAAIAGKFGVLDMARVHLEAREKILRLDIGGKNCKRISKHAGTFFLQTLSPFEATHRGFGETNLQLQKRNRALEVEVTERKRMEENLRCLSNQLLHAQEEERKRISRELHDEVGQALTAINMILAALKQNGARNSKIAGKKLADAQHLLQNTMQTVHDFARELRPAMLDELGLLPALRTYLQGFARRTGLRVQFRGNGIVEALSGDQKTVLFRVAQESLTNVAKHAHASRVEVSLRKRGDGVCLEVTDNGKSFRGDAMNGVKKNTRLGLLGMQERAKLANGKFTIRTQLGQGTTVSVMIPFRLNGTIQTKPKKIAAKL
jgi:signal transduction histidine kinase